MIDGLKKLNEIDVRIRTIRKDMERLPRELTEKQQGPKQLRFNIDRIKSDICKLKIEADSIELEVKSGEEALKRLATQMNVLRTSKEFDTVRRQMDAQRVWNKENESKALERMEQIDTKEKELEKNTSALNEAEIALAAETDRVNKELSELGVEHDKLKAERDEMAKDVPDKELAIYNRIVHTHGNAIATVGRGICSACFMKIPPQVHNLVLIGKELVCCPSCGRILTPAPQG
jgi:hypothetical protein